MSLTFREVPTTELPMELLLLADPSETRIRAYLPRSRGFLALLDGGTVGACAVQSVGPGVHELMNIAIAPGHQQAGHGTALLAWIIDTFRAAGACRLEVGTGAFGHQLAFYQRQGLRVTGIARDFFLAHYDAPVVENGLRHFDMLRLTLVYSDSPKHLA